MRREKRFFIYLWLLLMIVSLLKPFPTIKASAATKYTVSYNANGGTGAPSKQTKIKGTTLILSSTKPTRTGYTFQGWATSSTSNTVSYKAGGSYTKNADITLFAVWKAKTFKVTFDANGGYGGPTSQTKTYNVTLTLSNLTPNRSGYIFQGWATSPLSTPIYYPGSSFSGNVSMTLYAVWKKNVFTETVKNYLSCMDYSIDAFTEYTGRDRNNVAVQFYIWALGGNIGTGGLFGIGIDGVIGGQTLTVLKEMVNTTDIDTALPLLKEKLAPILERRSAEWTDIINKSGSKLGKKNYKLEDPKYLVFFENEEESQIDPIFAGRLAYFGKANHIPVFVQDGFRSYQLQVQRYVQSGGYQKADGTWTGGDNSAAKPGESWHEFGEAIDTYNLGIYCTEYLRNTLYSNTAATSQQTELINKGIFKPLTTGNNKSKPEAWHVQPYSETDGIAVQGRAEFYEAYTGGVYPGKRSTNTKITDIQYDKMMVAEPDRDKAGGLGYSLSDDITHLEKVSIDNYFAESLFTKSKEEILGEHSFINTMFIGEDDSQIGFSMGDGLTYTFNDDGTIDYIICDDSVCIKNAHGGQSFDTIISELGDNVVTSYSYSDNEVYYCLDYCYNDMRFRFSSINDPEGCSCVLKILHLNPDVSELVSLDFGKWNEKVLEDVE